VLSYDRVVSVVGEISAEINQLNTLGALTKSITPIMGDYETAFNEFGEQYETEYLAAFKITLFLMSTSCDAVARQADSRKLTNPDAAKMMQTIKTTMQAIPALMVSSLSEKIKAGKLSKPGATAANKIITTFDRKKERQSDKVDNRNAQQTQITILSSGVPLTPEFSEEGVLKFRIEKFPFVFLIPMLNRQIDASHFVKQVPIQICATTDRRVFSQVKSGVNLTGIPCFRPGTGMATSKRGDSPQSMRLFLSDGDAHNYFSDDRRIDGAQYSSLYINGIVKRNGDTSFTGPIYVVIYRDKNMNGIVDELEYDLLILEIAA
jgi:hypothetical protein